MSSQTDNSSHEAEPGRTPTDHAKLLIRGFERRNKEYPGEVWSRGLEVSLAWLRLLEADSVPEDEALAFVRLVHANRYRSSVWFDLALGVYSWARSKNLPIPPEDEYWSSEAVLGGSPELDPRKVPSKEYAEMLVEHFRQHADEDPGQDIWNSGWQAALAWLHLTETYPTSKTDAGALVMLLCESWHRSNGWTSLAWGVYYWSCANGFSDLWPDSWAGRLEA